MPADGEEMREVIEKRLHEKGLSWRGLARLLGVAPQSIYPVKRRNSCNIYMLERIARALEMSIADFPIDEIPGMRWSATTDEGRQVQRRARLRGWSDAELARRTGIGKDTIMRFFRGDASETTRQWVMEALAR